jgi:hypothetical protein
MGDHRFPLRLRAMPPRKPLRPNVEGGLWRRMQNMQPTLHSLPVESRSHSSPKANEHLSDLRPAEELLPVLHARSVIRTLDTGAGRRAQDDRTGPHQRGQQAVLRPGAREGD